MKDFNITFLAGKTLASVLATPTEDDRPDTMTIVTDDGLTYRMDHSQDCCESVSIHSIQGDLANLIGTPILSAKEQIIRDATELPADFVIGDDPWNDSFTATIFTFVTVKGTVVVRWLGESNGYYDESVNVYQLS